MSHRLRVTLYFRCRTTVNRRNFNVDNRITGARLIKCLRRSRARAHPRARRDNASQDEAHLYAQFSRVSSFIIPRHRTILSLTIFVLRGSRERAQFIITPSQDDGDIGLIARDACTWLNASARSHFCRGTRSRNCERRQPVKRESTPSSYRLS